MADIRFLNITRDAKQKEMKERAKVREWSTDPKLFLEYFPGSHIWATFNERGSKSVHHLYDSFDEVNVNLASENIRSKRGIFFTVNELVRGDHPKYRTKEMWMKSRAVFMDDDIVREEGMFKESWPLEPSLIVETSPGKFHYYWLTSRGVGGGYDKDDSWEEWQAVERAIVGKFGGDKQVIDLSRVLRLPGFKHMKSVESDSDIADAWTVRWHKCSGMTYEWSDIVEAFGVVYKTGKDRQIGESENDKVIGTVKGRALNELWDEIKQGINLHENINSIAWQMISDGASAKHTADALKAFMRLADPEVTKTERWQERYDDIERSVEGALHNAGNSRDREKVISSNSLEELNRMEDERIRRESGFNVAGSNNKGMPWPPGMMGGLCKDAYDMQIHQYEEMAIITATSIIAGICGRKFNINGMGLNVYMMLVMEPGRGKDQIAKFINRTLKLMSGIGLQTDQEGFMSFLGTSKNTGSKSILRSLKSARSQICIETESGMALQERSGSPEGLKRAKLVLYSRSGEGDVVGKEGYSAEEADVEAIVSPALSVIGETTPDTLFSALRHDAGSTGRKDGFLPRHSIYRLTARMPLPRLNRKSNKDMPQRDVSEVQLKRLIDIASKCKPIQAIDNPEVWHLEPTEEVWDDMEKRAKHYDPIINDHPDAMHRYMAGRMFAKELKFAALASAYNHHELVVKMPEWEWAKAMGDYEMSGLDNFFASSGLVGEDEVASAIKSVIAGRIVKIVSGKYKDSKQCPSTKDQKQKIFTLSNLRQTVRSQQRIIDLGSKYDKNKDGVWTCLERMVQDGTLIRVRDRKNCYQVIQHFFDIYSEE